MEHDRVVKMVLQAMTHEDVLVVFVRRIARDVVDTLRAMPKISMEGRDTTTSVRDLQIDRESREVRVHGSPCI